MSSSLTTSFNADLRFEVADFYAGYAAVIDRKQPLDWVATFVDEGVYRVGTHNNVSTTGMWWHTDRGLAALKERAAYTHGYFWKAPDKTLHSITNIRIVAEGRADVSTGGQTWTGATTYEIEGVVVMFAADRGEQSELYVCGQFQDTLVKTGEGLRLLERRVIIDSETVPPNMGVLL